MSICTSVRGVRRRVKYCQYPEKCTRSLFNPEEIRSEVREFARSRLARRRRVKFLRRSLSALVSRKKKRSDGHTYSLMLLKREKEREGAGWIVSGDFPSFVNSSPPLNPRRLLSLFRFISRALFAQRRFFATAPAPVHHLRRPDVRPSFPVSRIRRSFFFLFYPARRRSDRWAINELKRPSFFFGQPLALFVRRTAACFAVTFAPPLVPLAIPTLRTSILSRSLFLSL